MSFSVGKVKAKHEKAYIHAEIIRPHNTLTIPETQLLYPPFSVVNMQNKIFRFI